MAIHTQGPLKVRPGASNIARGLASTRQPAWTGLLGLAGPSMCDTPRYFVQDTPQQSWPCLGPLSRVPDNRDLGEKTAGSLTSRCGPQRSDDDKDDGGGSKVSRSSADS